MLTAMSGTVHLAATEREAIAPIGRKTMTKHVLALSTALTAAMLIQTAAFAQQDTNAGAPAPQPTSVDSQAPGISTAGGQPTPTADNSEIIVTATKRVTTLQKTPIAITVFNQGQLDRQQVANVSDLQRFVPSLQFNFQGDQTAVLLTLRGIGNDSAYTEVADPEVAIYIDGLYSSRAQGATALLYDLERVEVLRGPQGTLFGRNATVGAVSLVSAKPNFDGVHGYAEILAGDYDRIGSRAAINIPVTNTLAMRFAFASEQHDGYAYFQPAPNVPNVNASAYVTTGKRYYAQDQKSARFSALWEPSSNFHWNLNAELFYDKGAPVVPLLQTPRPGTHIFSIQSDTAPDTNRYSWSIRSNMDYNINDYLDFTYIAGFQRIGGSTQSDADYGAIPPDGTFVANPDPKGYPSTVQYPISGFGENRTVYSRYDFLSQEIQLKSRGKHVIDWIVGGYFSHEKNQIRFDVDQRNGYRDGATRGFVGSFIQPDREIDSYAAFGQATWNIRDRLRLTGGVRYTSDTKSDVGGRNITAFGCPAPDPVTGIAPPCIGIFGLAPGASATQLLALLGPGFGISNNDVNGTFSKVTYLGRVDFDVSQNILAYGSVSSGFKSGNIEDGGRLAQPETLTNYEIGAKTRLFDRKLTLNVAAYYSDFQGYQVNQVVNTRDTNGNIVASQIVTTNADGAKAYGFEAEATANLTNNDHLSFAGAVQKTELKSLLAPDGRFDGGFGRQLRGNELPHAPRFSATVTYEHDFVLPNGGHITPRGTVHYETRSFLTYFNGDRKDRVVNGVPVYFGSRFDQQSAYTRRDLSLRYTAPQDKYVVEGFVQNVEDARVRTSSAASGYPRYAPVFLSVYQAPRTFGVRVKAAF